MLVLLALVLWQNLLRAFGHDCIVDFAVSAYRVSAGAEGQKYYLCPHCCWFALRAFKKCPDCGEKCELEKGKFRGDESNSGVRLANVPHACLIPRLEQGVHVWVPGAQLISQREKGRKGRWRAAVDGPRVPVTLSKLSKTELTRGTILTVHSLFEGVDNHKKGWAKKDRIELTCDIRLANGKVLRYVPSMLCVVACGDEGLVDLAEQKIARKIKRATPLVHSIGVFGDYICIRTNSCVLS